MHIYNITEPKSPLACANMLHPYLKGLKPLTPDICRKILSHTNSPRIIKDTLQAIAATPDIAQYQSVILNMFDHRLQPDSIAEIATSLAQTHHFAAKLQAIRQNCKNDDIVLLSSPLPQNAVWLDREYEHNGSQHLADIGTAIFPPQYAHFSISEKFTEFKAGLDLSRNKNISALALEIGHLPEPLQLPPHLAYLGFSFYAPGLEPIPLDFSPLDKLETLNLDFNYGQPQLSLPASLHTLIIHKSKLTVENFDFMAAPNLHALKLHEVNFFDGKAPQLPQTIKALEIEETPLPENTDLSCLKNLKTLSLHKRTARALPRLPVNIEELKLTGKLDAEIDLSAMGRLRKLTIISSANPANKTKVIIPPHFNAGNICGDKVIARCAAGTQASSALAYALQAER